MASRSIITDVRTWCRGFRELVMQNARSFSVVGLLVILAAAAAPACENSPQGSGGSGAGGSGASATSTGTNQGGNGTAGSGVGGLITGGAPAGGSSSGGAPSGGSSAGGAPSGGSSAGGSGGSGGVVILEVACLNQTYHCGDTIDNDGDGLTDWQDPDCLGPCDNTEDSYFGGIPGQSGPNCDVDCYWDQNSGSGDDECYWNHKCDPNEQNPPGHPEPIGKCPYDENTNLSGTPLGCNDLYQMQGDVCTSFCGPITPNGCDCFGCCELPAGGGKYVWLGSEDENGNGSCTKDAVDDPDKCEPCLPVAGCLNACDVCELCIGKDELPPECTPGGSGGGGAGGNPSSTSSGMGGASSSSTSSGTGGSGQCPAGVQACGLPGQAPCPAGFYCITGCCVQIMDPK
jgi:hypothetical protein